MARRWKCPRCDTGRLAPERMAQDDVRRYCLPCSEATGKLVPMECPVLERARAEKRERRNRQVRIQRRSEVRDKYFTRDGHDTRKLGRRVARMKLWRDEGIRVKGDVEPLPGSGNARAIADTWVLNRFWHACTSKWQATDPSMAAVFVAAVSEYYGVPVADLRQYEEVWRRLNPAKTGTSIYWVMDDALKAFNVSTPPEDTDDDEG